MEGPMNLKDLLGFAVTTCLAAEQQCVDVKNRNSIHLP